MKQPVGTEVYQHPQAVRIYSKWYGL